MNPFEMAIAYAQYIPFYTAAIPRRRGVTAPADLGLQVDAPFADRWSRRSGPPRRHEARRSRTGGRPLQRRWQP